MLSTLPADFRPYARVDDYFAQEIDDYRNRLEDARYDQTTMFDSSKNIVPMYTKQEINQKVIIEANYLWMGYRKSLPSSFQNKFQYQVPIPIREYQLRIRLTYY